MEPKKMDSTNQDHHNKTTRRSADEKIHAEQVIIDNPIYEEEDKASTNELMCNAIEGLTMKLRARNDEMSVSRMEKLMDNLKREVDKVDACSDVIARRFKEILYKEGEDERVAELVRRVKDEVELQRKKELEDLEKKESASWSSWCMRMYRQLAKKIMS